MKSKNRSLRTKMFIAIISVVVVMLICISAMFFFNMGRIADMLLDSNQEMSETSINMSSESIDDFSRIRLQELADDKAEIADNMFAVYEQAVCILASTAERLYADPDQYSAREVPLPEMEKDGELSIQTLFAEDVDPNDYIIREELGLLGNIQDSLYVMNEKFESMASVYVASESGIVVMADSISGKKFDEDGNIMPLDARKRPWYQGAKETGGPYYTPVTRDSHTPRRGIMCGVPVYVGDDLMGVAGAGMYLDDIETLVRNIDFGEAGDACIINQYGQVLFSTFTEGTLAASADGEDVRTGAGGQLAELVNKAVGLERGVALVEIDGVQEYVAYAPMKTVGWSLLTVLPKEEVEEPAAELQQDLNRISEQATSNARRSIQIYYAIAVLMCLAAVLASVINSYKLSKRIVEPIQKLTREVKKTDGDNLDFTWNLDTGDEIQTLADSFRSLTQRMKEYIRDIQAITSERERIEAELTLSARIQNSMLPNIFPPYPSRPEFDIYAKMNPARQVGGDFYDFFMIDEDHLCLVIADVSGKGVPAALFMMISKMILQNCAKMCSTIPEILEKTNELICDNNPEEMFVTVWIGILEISTGKLTAANAGHEYPIIMQPGEQYELLRDKHGFVLGAMEEVKYKEYEVMLRPGARVFIYTDGLTEASDPDNKMFGTERMLDSLNRRTDASLMEVLQGIQNDVDAFARGAVQFDDLTMLCLEYKGME